MTSDDKSNEPTTPDEAIAALDSLCVEMVGLLGRFESVAIGLVEMSNRVSADEKERIIAAAKRFADTIETTVMALGKLSADSKP